MNKYTNKTGGSPLFGTDLKFVQDNAISGMTGIVKGLIESQYYNDNIIINGVNATLISGGTVNAYFTVQEGMMWVGQELCFVAPQTIPYGGASSLSQLFFTKTDTYDGLSIYFDSTTNYNYTSTVVQFGTTGSYSYTTSKTLGDILQQPTYIKESFTVADGSNYSFNLTPTERTNYITITKAANALTGTSYINLPNPTEKNKGKIIYIKFDISFEPFAPTVIVRTVAGTTIESITKMNVTGAYEGVWTLQYDGTTINVIEKNIVGYNSATPTGFPFDTNEFEEWVSPAVLTAIYPTTTSVVSIGIWNMSSTANVYVSATTLATKTIYAINGYVINDAQTIQYPIPSMSTTDYPLLVVDKWWPNGVVSLTRKASLPFDSTDFDDSSINRGYLLITHSI
jgi:hypothetical protein